MSQEQFSILIKKCLITLFVIVRLDSIKLVTVTQPKRPTGCSLLITLCLRDSEFGMVEWQRSYFVLIILVRHMNYCVIIKWDKVAR